MWQQYRIHMWRVWIALLRSISKNLLCICHTKMASWKEIDTFCVKITENICTLSWFLHIFRIGITILQLEKIEFTITKPIISSMHLNKYQVQHRLEGIQDATQGSEFLIKLMKGKTSSDLFNCLVSFGLKWVRVLWSLWLYVVLCKLCIKCWITGNGLLFKAILSVYVILLYCSIYGYYCWQYLRIILIFCIISPSCHKA